MKVVKVTKDFFETDDGSQYEHFEKLDEVPSLVEFQKIYDDWSLLLKGNLKKHE